LSSPSLVRKLRRDEPEKVAQPFFG
jgi:hypothetical protein